MLKALACYKNPQLSFNINLTNQLYDYFLEGEALLFYVIPLEKSGNYKKTYNL